MGPIKANVAKMGKAYTLSIGSNRSDSLVSWHSKDLTLAESYLIPNLLRMSTA